MKFNMAGATRWTVLLGGGALLLGAKLAGIGEKLAIIAGMGAGRELAKVSFGSSSSANLDQQIDTALRSAEESIAPTLPRRLDAYTVLTGIHHTGRVLTYSYSLGTGAAEPDFEALEARLKDQVCNNESMVKMMGYGASFIYEYRDSRDYRRLGEITITHC